MFDQRRRKVKKRKWIAESLIVGIITSILLVLTVVLLMPVEARAEDPLEPIEYIDRSWNAETRMVEESTKSCADYTVVAQNQGSWDVTPGTETVITAAATYTFRYVQKDSISATVTFKVVNGSWDNETDSDKLKAAYP